MEHRKLTWRGGGFASNAAPAEAAFH